jgi:5-methylcytosine-specific restriction enzyme subunit McrC
MNKVHDHAVHWTEYGIPIRNLWHMLMYVWNEVPLSRAVSLQDVETAPTLDVLFASLLIKLMRQRLRIGLGRGYQDEKHLLHGIRGRVNFSESLKHGAFEHEEAYCEFQEYSLNIPRNQIVRSTLMRLIQTGNFGPERAMADELRHRLRWITRLLNDVDLIELDLEFVRRQQAQRHDRDYLLMLSICELILLRQMPQQASETRNLPSVDHDALILHHIYERFVANFYRLHLKGWEVSPQKVMGWHEKNEVRHLPSMRPDLFLRETSSARIIILDTKFTAQSLKENPWGGKGFDSTHLYQLYAYLKTQEHLSESHAQAAGILLYPTVNDVHLSERIELQGHTLRIESVDLTMPWQKIEKHLLEMVLTAG